MNTASIEFKATLARLPGVCPTCQSISTQVHGYYNRRIKDLPIWQREVVILLRVRRFCCLNPKCERQTFSQKCSELVERYQRGTNRLLVSLYHIGQELGGKAGSRLAKKLNMPTSRDSLLRIIRRFPELPFEAVRVLGIDDWAFRKGRRYGTILVDLEARRVIDLLPDRTAETIMTWLLQQPQVEIVARDRSKEYALGIQEGAPTATQVADRWHLLKNLSEVTERALVEIYPILKNRVDSVQTEIVQKQGLRSKFPRSQTEERVRHERRLKRMRQHEMVHYLSANGLSTRRIARILSISRGTVIRYLRAPSFPESSRQQLVPSILDPYLPYLEKRFQAGCHNAHQLWQEIEAMGYPGAVSQVRKWTQWRRKQSKADSPALTAPITPIFLLPQVTEVYKLLSTNRDILTPQEQWLVHRMKQIPEIENIDDLVQQFKHMIQDRDATVLNDWIMAMKHSQIKALVHFAEGIEQDYEAVKAAMTYHWSSGQTEGQVNRLKMLKRQMYGRAKLDLLKKRIMYLP